MNNDDADELPMVPEVPVPEPVSLVLEGALAKAINDYRDALTEKKLAAAALQTAQREEYQAKQRVERAEEREAKQASALSKLVSDRLAEAQGKVRR